MPARTNPAQRLVARIYQAIASAGVTVKESQLQAEASLTEKREVDILIECPAGILARRVAVEVRNWRRKQDITWIDGLVGRYLDMDIERVIAVSSSGFTPAALAKAAVKGIEALTLADAEKFDWPGQFTRLGFGGVTPRDEVEFSIRTEPAIPGPVGDRLPVGTKTEVRGTLQDILVEVRNQAQLMVHKWFADHYRELTLGDVKNKVIRLSKAVPLLRPWYIHLPDGTKPEIKEVHVRLERRFDVDIPKTKNLILLGDTPQALASTADVNIGQIKTITVVQSPDNPGQAKVFFEESG